MLAVRAMQSPAFMGGRTVDKTGVPRQVSRRARNTALLEIGGRCTENPPCRRKSPRNQTRFFELADADSHVDAFVDQVDKTVCQREREPDLGISGEVARDHRP